MKFEVWTQGPKQGRTLLFLHGYPDDHTLWDGLVSQFSRKHRCITVDYPNSGKELFASGSTSFADLASLLKETLDAKLGREDWKVTLVCHDWGAIHAYQFARMFPDHVEAIVAADVGASLSSQKNPVGYVAIPAYQLSLAGAYLATRIPRIGMPLASGWTLGVLSGLKALNRGAGAKKLKGPVRKNALSPLQNYPYWEFWKGLALGNRRARGKLPKVPILFIHGRQGIKKYMDFHDDAWIRFVESTPGGQAVAFENSGHWPMLDEPERFSVLMEGFLERTLGSAQQTQSGAHERPRRYEEGGRSGAQRNPDL